MTKDQYLEAKEKASNYQSLEYELDKVDEALKNIKHYSRISLDTQTGVPMVNIGVNSQIRDDLVTLLQNYRTWIAGQMEAI